MLILKVGKPNLTLKQYEDFHSINSFKYKFEVFEANSDIVSQFQAKNCIISINHLKDIFEVSLSHF